MTRRRRRAAALVVAAALAAIGCRAGGDVRCDERGAALGLDMHLELDVATSLPTSARAEALDALGAWARCTESRVDAQGERLELGVPFTVTHDALAKLPPAEAERALTEPLRVLAERLGVERRAKLTIALLPDIARPDAAASAVLGDAAGLGIPATTAPGAEAPWQRALPPVRGPLVLISWEQWRRLSPGARAAIVTHEIGHAFGLGHDDRPGNAMERGVATRPGWLDADQAARVRASFDELRARAKP